ncbi:MAG: right-handed parallel beta-helix repeat-containing protein [Verrucomicrobiota bacterium]
MMLSSRLWSAEFHVSPQGSDTNDGSPPKPFATLERARDAMRAALKNGDNTIWIHDGNIALPKTLELTAADSGVIYRSIAGETVRLSGGRAVVAADFKPVTDVATLARIAEPARGKIVELDLVALGIQHRRPYPDVFNDNGSLIELYFNGVRMPLSRFPNRGYMTMKRVLNNAGGNRKGAWDSANFEKVAPGSDGGTFEYRDEFAAQHASWQKVLDRGVWLKGYWRCAWENEAIRVKAIDLTNKTVTFAKPIPGGIGSKYKRPAGSGEEQYWLMNLLEEVDQPGEWCVDFPSGKLYFYPPAPLAGARIVICDNDQPVIRLTGATNVVLRQLTVECNVGHGIEIKGGESDHIRGCVVCNVSRNAIVLDGGFHHEVLSCDLHNLGAGGVWLAGGDDKSSPRVLAGHRIVNNHIHDFGQVVRVLAAGVNCGFAGGGVGRKDRAVGMYVAHNLIHGTPHVGILFGSWDSLFEYNEILDFCKVSNDMGGWYCYDQFAFNGNQTFRYNYIHSSGEGDGVYFDNDHRDMHIYGNVIALDSVGKRGTGFLYKIGTQGKGNPQSIECTNNIAINCNYGYEFVSALPSKIENNIAVNCKYPFGWGAVVDGKVVRNNADFATGMNVSYDGDPGFVDMAKHDFRLKPDSKVFKDLPGFQPIPFDKIGLFKDEYRQQLPTDKEAGRVGSINSESLGIKIEDRTY